MAILRDPLLLLIISALFRFPALYIIRENRSFQASDADNLLQPLVLVKKRAAHGCFQSLPRGRRIDFKSKNFFYSSLHTWQAAWVWLFTWNLVQFFLHWSLHFFTLRPIWTLMLHPHIILQFFYGTQQEKIMGSEGVFMGLDYERWLFWTF
jgi:hypothetical protein